MKLQPHELGSYFETSDFHGLLGNRKSTPENLALHFPQLNFKRIKQTHGDRVVHTSAHSINFASEADGHYCNDSNLALCISTADCIPIFLYHSEPRWIVGIHAGWRGIQNRIVPKAISVLRRQGCYPKNILVFIGPHIQKSSFEVENKVRDLILESFPSNEKKELFYSALTPLKSLVDLHLVLEKQLEESHVDLNHIVSEKKDTVSDLKYDSYRREGALSGRQISWICLK